MRLITTSSTSLRALIVAAIASLAVAAALLLAATPVQAQPDDDYTSYPSYSSSYQSGPTNDGTTGDGTTGGTAQPPAPAPAPVVTQQRTPLGTSNPPASLPFTGGNADMMALIGAGFIAVGAVAIGGQRRARQIAFAPSHLKD